MWEDWSSKQNILVILAHPDDPEFFCGATIARWTASGHRVVYWLLTCGDKGAQDPVTDTNALCSARVGEQKTAAAMLGVHEVNFLGYPDGHLVADLELRREVTRIIRLEHPDILVTCDPRTLFFGDTRLNHPDHRAAGQVVLDAAFPAAGNALYFPEQLQNEGLKPHNVKEIWASLTLEPNIKMDVTDFWETKIRALYEHKSQIGQPEQLAERMRSRHTSESTPEKPRYEEHFKRIVFPQ